MARRMFDIEIEGEERTVIVEIEGTMAAGFSATCKFPHGFAFAQLAGPFANRSLAWEAAIRETARMRCEGDLGLEQWEG